MKNKSRHSHQSSSSRSREQEADKKEREGRYKQGTPTWHQPESATRDDENLE